MRKSYFNNRKQAVQAETGSFLTTLKRCLCVLGLPFVQPGGFLRTLGLRAGEPNCAKISGNDIKRLLEPLAGLDDCSTTHPPRCRAQRTYRDYAIDAEILSINSIEEMTKRLPSNNRAKNQNKKHPCCTAGVFF